MAKRRFMPVRTRTRVVSIARRARTAAFSGASNQKHTIAAVAAAALLGWLEQSQKAKGTDNLPQIDALGVAGTWGAAAWAIGKMTKNKMAEHVATGLLSVAAYQWSSKPKTETSGDMSGFVDGDDDLSGEGDE